MGMTVAEKILARASDKKSVRPDEYVTAKVAMMLAGEKALLFRYMAEIGIDRVWDPERIVVVTDHRVPSRHPAIVQEGIYQKAQNLTTLFLVKTFKAVWTKGIATNIFRERALIQSIQLE